MTDYSHLTPDNTPIVKVLWFDIVSVDNWNEDENAEIATITTIGWLLENNPKWVKVAGSYSWDDGSWSSQTVFPKGEPDVEIVVDQVGTIERLR